MESIGAKIQQFLSKIPAGCTLVAVSKTKPKEAIMEAYNVGQRDFGENKVQELVTKSEELPKDIHWHMIGHLQRNKVKYIAPFVDLIHSVDSLRLLKEINKQGEKANRKINCLLQVHIAEEESKFGLDRLELQEIIDHHLESLAGVKVVGLMGMATNTSDESQVQKEFAFLEDLFLELKNSTTSNLSMDILSTGMSGDYEIALQNGSNMIRVGSSIFGARNY